MVVLCGAAMVVVSRGGARVVVVVVVVMMVSGDDAFVVVVVVLAGGNSVESIYQCINGIATNSPQTVTVFAINFTHALNSNKTVMDLDEIADRLC